MPTIGCLPLSQAHILTCGQHHTDHDHDQIKQVPARNNLLLQVTGNLHSYSFYYNYLLSQIFFA